MVKVPGGIEFELNTPAFVVMAFAVILVIISAWIKDSSPSSVARPGAPTTASEPPPQSFDKLGDLVRFGCEQDATSQVTYDAPSGWKIADASADVGSNTGDVKDQSATITERDNHHIEAKADFRGRDKDFGLICPSGGHGQVEIKGMIVKAF